MDCDRLISLVHDQSPIWDKGDILFKDRTAREKCWLEVARGIRDDWEELSTSDKNNELTEMKNKWKHIRDHYVRSLNGGNSGDPATKKRKYTYADALEFLKNSLEKRCTSGNVGEPTGAEDTQDSSPRSTQHPPTPSTATPEYHSETPAITSASRLKKKTSGAMSQFQSLLLKTMESSDSNDDPDKAYLFSLLPFYKSLTQTQKLKFQQHSLNFMLAVKEAEHPTSPNLPDNSRDRSELLYPYSQPALFPSSSVQPNKPFLPYSLPISQNMSQAFKFQYPPIQVTHPITTPSYDYATTPSPSSTICSPTPPLGN